MGHKASQFLPAFALLYAMSVVVFVIGQWDRANFYGFEAPLVALIFGAVIGNLVGPPALARCRISCRSTTSRPRLSYWGATVPFTLIIWAGPGCHPASLESCRLVTFFVIYFVAKRLGIERRLAATLGVGGAGVRRVRGPSRYRARWEPRKRTPPIAITLVLIWAIVMIFVLPIVAHALRLPAGVGGAWIGTSEFADAAGPSRQHRPMPGLSRATILPGAPAIRRFLPSR